MLVGDIGEFELIDILLGVLNERPAVHERDSPPGLRLLVGPGDDAAAWTPPNEAEVMTTDTLVEGVHFNRAHTSWGDLGWKCLTVNLSDVAAMGCSPGYAAVTLGLQAKLPVNGLVEMYRGILDVTGRYGGAVVGGDVVRSPVFFVSVALTGVAVAGRPVLTRSAALAGDVIAVTGSLGCSAGGLKTLEAYLGLDDWSTEHLRNAHNRPFPRVKEGAILAEFGVKVCLDVSDGLVADLDKLCEASNVGAVLHADDVPVDDFLRKAFPDEWRSLALSGGEDYELLFTAPPGVVESAARKLDVPVAVIGEVVEGRQGVTVLDGNGDEISVETGGWDHFAGG